MFIAASRLFKQCRLDGEIPRPDGAGRRRWFAFGVGVLVGNVIICPYWFRSIVATCRPNSAVAIVL